MKLYLIDIDGTLLLSGGAGNRALDRSFLELHGVADAMRGIRPAGKTDPMIVAEAFRAALGRTPSEGEVGELLRRYLVHLPGAIASAPGFRLLAGVPSGLDRLRAEGHALGVATGNIRQAAQIKLARGGLDAHFCFGGYGDDSPDRPTLVGLAALRGMAQFGECAPQQVVVVGDTARDVAAAKAHGFCSVAVASGTVERQELEKSRPDRIVAGLDEL
ncbi:MAG: HAD family hydrolase [bacterium]